MGSLLGDEAAPEGESTGGDGAHWGERQRAERRCVGLCKDFFFFFCLRQNRCAIIDMGAQSCSTLCDPMYCIPPDSSVYGIFQTRILELPFPFPSDFPDPGIEPMSPVSYVFCLAVRFFTTAPPEKLCDCWPVNKCATNQVK